MPQLPGAFLAFDTSAAHCAAAVVSATGQVLALRHEDMSRGQAERLMPMLEELLAEAGLCWADLAALAVGTGPGNFTGVRIAVAAARGLGLALARPVVGISGFEMALCPTAPEAEGPLLLTLAAPRGQFYVQAYEAGRALGPPELVDPAAAELALRPAGARLRGAGAEVLAAVLGLAVDPGPAAPDGGFAARLAARAAYVLARPLPQGRPAPLYVRPADAAPPSDPPPVILDA